MWEACFALHSIFDYFHVAFASKWKAIMTVEYNAQLSALYFIHIHCTACRFFPDIAVFKDVSLSRFTHTILAKNSKRLLSSTISAFPPFRIM